MHLLVTDRLACPRCGPEFGIVLLADRLEDRRVLEGALGCPNCRETYPIERGYGHLRPASDSAHRYPGSPHADLSEDDPEGAMRLGALLGVAEGPGLILLAGSPVRHAERLSAMIEDIEVVAVHPGLREVEEREGVSRISVGERLPFFSGALRGVAVEGPLGRERLSEAVRVLARAARLVFFDPPDGVRDEMESLGIELLMEADSVLVGARK